MLRSLNDTVKAALSRQDSLSSDSAKALQDKMQRLEEQVESIDDKMGQMRLLLRSGLVDIREEMLRPLQRLLRVSERECAKQFFTDVQERLYQKGKLIAKERLSIHLEKKLGTGGFGAVYEGCLDKSIDVAVKLFTPRDTLAHTEAALEQDLLREAYLMMLIGDGHHSFVKLYGEAVPPGQQWLGLVQRQALRFSRAGLWRRQGGQFMNVTECSGAGLRPCTDDQTDLKHCWLC